jgi:serine/threonine-protein kinase
MTSQPLAFQRFEVGSRLALGGMGEILRCRDARTQRPAILKVLRNDKLPMRGIRERFEHEIEVSRRLRHALIPAHLADGTWDGRRAVAMERVDGVTLRHLLDVSNKRLAPAIAASITLDVLRALDAVHACTDDDGMPLGLVHGDISPENIIVDDRGSAHLIDFGISIDRHFSGDLAPGTVIGKLGYLSPEQMRAWRHDQRADQFAAGVVLMEMLTLRNMRMVRATAPVPGDPAEVFPLDPRAWRERGIPDELALVATTLLESDVERRYSTCAEAARVLNGVAAELPLETLQTVPAMVAQARRTRKKTRTARTVVQRFSRDRPAA